MVGDKSQKSEVKGQKNSLFVISYSLLSFYLLMIGGWLIDTAYANDNQKIVLSLDQCIKKAVEVSPEIGESRYEEEVYKSKKLQADSAAYPQIEVLAIAGPSPEAKREYISPSINTSVATTINGIFGSADVTLIQPIYTFGKISSFKQAASSGIRVAKAGVDKRTSDIILRTKELYYSILMAKDMRNLILEVKDDLVESIKKAEKQIEIGSPWADEINLFKLRTFLGEVDRNLNETEKGIALAKDALLTSMGFSRGTDFDIADTSLTPEKKIPEDVSVYMRNSIEFRSEFVQLKEGLKARNALIDAEKSNYYPQLFVGLKASVAGATNRDKVDNPYIYDPLNHAYGAVFIGIKWSIDFGITEGRVKEARAEYHKLIEKKRFADEAIPFQVRRAYLDMKESEKNIVETEKAYKNARKWLIAAIANFDMGIGDAKEVADAAMAYIQMKANNIRSIYNHRMSFANLLYATGMDIQEIK
ncbi:outer membrane efflux protein [Dissulfurispira thermophila]|uniref:Outer membrane efflux protein n=2 Tax=Dissulfurispira thermophila TaxID=2715679 RepID=A0A7G1H3T9_9BACT|nr:outer membrane efflux protein [Dissulfurispira thermophila]